jgi:hypothetical protein
MAQAIARPAANPMKRVFSVCDFFLLENSTALFLSAGGLMILCALYLLKPGVGTMLSTHMAGAQSENS